MVINLKQIIYFKCVILSFTFLLHGCYSLSFRQLYGLNSFLYKSFGSIDQPSLGVDFLGMLSNYNGREKIALLDLKTRRALSLPGINRFDFRPISLSISADGNKIAFITEVSDQIKLFVYTKKTGSLQPLYLSSKGIPQKLSMDGLGSLLAVEFVREGRTLVDLVKIPGYL